MNGLQKVRAGDFKAFQNNIEFDSASGLFV